MVFDLCNAGPGGEEENGTVNCLGSLIFTESLLKFVDTFVYEIGRAETDREKRAKIDNLALSNDEWTRVTLFLELLAVGIDLLTCKFLFLIQLLIVRRLCSASILVGHWAHIASRFASARGTTQSMDSTSKQTTIFSLCGGIDCWN
jgi:hypothetical protein